jgi:hypothetical protein
MPTRMKTVKSCLRSWSSYIGKQCLVKAVQTRPRNTLHCEYSQVYDAMRRI